jgi:hypothetical protein
MTVRLSKEAEEMVDHWHVSLSATEVEQLRNELILSGDAIEGNAVQYLNAIIRGKEHESRGEGLPADRPAGCTQETGASND